MGDKPGKYWDHNECRWVNYAPSEEQVQVPAQAEPVEDDQTVVGIPI